MNEKNLKYLEDERIVKKNQLKFLLDYVLSESENLLVSFEDIKEVRSSIPGRGFSEDVKIYMLTNKKIIFINLKENDEKIELVPIKQIIKTTIEREIPMECDKECYSHINRIKNIIIDFKNHDPIIFNISEANSHYDIPMLKNRALEFIKKINEII